VKDLKGKVAFITGGASGIGLGIAKACARQGMKVIIADMRQKALDETLKYFKDKKLPAYAINLNVTDREAYARAAAEAEKAFGKIHVLVSNAGVGGGGSAIKTTYKDWDYTIGVNIGGTVNSVVTMLPYILKHGEGGHIAATASTLGLAAAADNIPYCTTKFAITGMMEALATELQDKNIGVSVVFPGPTTSDLGNSSSENRPANLKTGDDIWPPRPKEGAPTAAMMNMDIMMSAEEAGERVVRGIRNNDLFILTHSEYKEGFIARHNAIIRAVPNEPVNPKRLAAAKQFGTIYYNDIYDKQKPVGPPDW
jgi:NAD(P)-dependent dehydrogenase (short-subunit alcohol dehydrogenase family)